MKIIIDTSEVSALDPRILQAIVDAITPGKSKASPLDISSPLYRQEDGRTPRQACATVEIDEDNVTDIKVTAPNLEIYESAPTTSMNSVVDSDLEEIRVEGPKEQLYAIPQKPEDSALSEKPKRIRPSRAKPKIPAAIAPVTTVAVAESDLPPPPHSEEDPWSDFMDWYEVNIQPVVNGEKTLAVAKSMGYDAVTFVMDRPDLIPLFKQKLDAVKQEIMNGKK